MTRIIAGEFGGRRLRVPDGRETRPTSERTREALFASLDATHDLDGGPFLDLYSGSGAVGLEAISRGAPRAVLVESSRQALATISTNVADLRVAGRVQVVAAKVEVVASRLRGLRAHTVFVDPPYGDDGEALAAVLGDLVNAEVIDAQALVVVERDRRSGWQWPAVMEGLRDRRYGETTLWYGQPAQSAIPNPMNPQSDEVESMMSPSTPPAVKRVVCPGSFDPIHRGHLDIIARASKIFDEVVALVLVNPNKQTMFSLEERQRLILDSAAEIGVTNVRVDSASGLLVDYCRENDVCGVVKGLRVATDFDYEIQMSQMNYKIAGVETLFLTTNPEHSYISSSLVKEVAKYGGDVRPFLSEAAYDALVQRLAHDG